MVPKYYAAIDLGGTKIYSVLADESLQIIASERIRTDSGQGAKVILAQMAGSVRRLLEAAGLTRTDLGGVGVCTAGFFDAKKRVLVSSPNLPGFCHSPLEEMLAENLGVSVLAENDANAAALGEACFGAGKDAAHLVYVTISTGIGAGIVFNRSIYRGTRGFAGELGHMAVKPDGPLCGCGRRGCLETLASGRAIGRRAREEVAKGARTVLRDMVPVEELGAAHVFAAAGQKDETAVSILEEAILYLGSGLANLVNLLNPDCLVIGGGVSEAGEALLVPLVEELRRRAIAPAADSVTIKKSALGMEAGIRGMLALMRKDGSYE